MFVNVCEGDGWIDGWMDGSGTVAAIDGCVSFVLFRGVHVVFVVVLGQGRSCYFGPHLRKGAHSYRGAKSCR